MISGTAGEAWYISGMDYTDYSIIKAAVLIAVVAVVSFVYALLNGQTIEEARRDKRQEPTHPEEH